MNAPKPHDGNPMKTLLGWIVQVRQDGQCLFQSRCAAFSAEAAADVGFKRYRDGLKRPLPPHSVLVVWPAPMQSQTESYTDAVNAFFYGSRPRRKISSGRTGKPRHNQNTQQ